MGRGEECSATVVGLDLVLALSKVRQCSLKRSFRRRLVSPMYCRWYLSGAPNENIVQNHLNIALSNVF